MAEFSVEDRILKAGSAVAAPVAWFVFAPDAPDFDPLFDTPIGSLTVEQLIELIVPIVWLLLLVPCGYWTITFLYEAIAGREAGWFWHP